MDTVDNAQVRGLHAVIESRLQGQSVILVTGARLTDGAASLAAAITSIFRSSGSSVALVRVAPTRYGVAQTSLPGEIQPPDVSATRADLEETLRHWRDSYDLVVIEASPFLQNQLAPRLAGLADGVVVALEKGRSISEDDRGLVALLNSVEARALGIITTAPPKRSLGWLPALFKRFAPATKAGRSADAPVLFSRS